MIESHGVNTSLTTQHYNHFTTDFSFLHEASDMVARQGNLRIQSVTRSDQRHDRSNGAGEGFDELRGLVLNIFTDQGMNAVIAADDTMLDISSLSREEAQELIAEDGYFGVEKMSERIFQFAIGVTDDDPLLSGAVRHGVEKGFDQARNVLGGWLPDISCSTFDAVMNKLDDWAGVSTSQTIRNQVSS